MPTTDLTPGTITTLGALRPGDAGETLDSNERFLLEENDIHPLMRFVGSYCVGSHDESVRYLGRGRIEPARIVMEGEGEMETPIEQTVRRVLAVAVADGLVTCAREPMTMTTGELVGPANTLSSAMGEQQRRIAELEEQVRKLREALNMYRSAFGQALEAHGIPLGPQQRLADEISEAALAATAPKEETPAK